MTKLDSISRFETNIFPFVANGLSASLGVLIGGLIDNLFLKDLSRILTIPIWFILASIIYIIAFFSIVATWTNMLPAIRRITGIKDTTDKMEEELCEREAKEEEKFREKPLDDKLYDLWRKQSYYEKYYLRLFKQEFKGLAFMLFIMIVMLGIMLGRLFKLF